MNLRKKLVVLISLGLILPILTSATAIPNPLKWERLGDLVNAVSKFIFEVALALAPIMIIVGGFYFITAAGEPEKIQTGKKIIANTLIGLVIILLASGLIAILTKAVTGH